MSVKKTGKHGTADHTVDSCQSCLLTKLESGLTILHEAEDDDINWLNSAATTAVAK